MGQCERRRFGRWDGARNGLTRESAGLVLGCAQGPTEVRGCAGVSLFDWTALGVFAIHSMGEHGSELFADGAVNNSSAEDFRRYTSLFPLPTGGGRQTFRKEDRCWPRQKA